MSLILKTNIRNNKAKIFVDLFHYKSVHEIYPSLTRRRVNSKFTYPCRKNNIIRIETLRKPVNLVRYDVRFNKFTLEGFRVNFILFILLDAVN